MESVVEVEEDPEARMGCCGLPACTVAVAVEVPRASDVSVSGREGDARISTTRDGCGCGCGWELLLLGDPTALCGDDGWDDGRDDGRDSGEEMLREEPRWKRARPRDVVVLVLGAASTPSIPSGVSHCACSCACRGCLAIGSGERARGFVEGCRCVRAI